MCHNIPVVQKLLDGASKLRLYGRHIQSICQCANSEENASSSGLIGWYWTTKSWVPVRVWGVACRTSADRMGRKTVRVAGLEANSVTADTSKQASRVTAHGGRPLMGSSCLPIHIDRPDTYAHTHKNTCENPQKVATTSPWTSAALA